MEPVPLTSAQIKDILRAVPRPRGVGKTAVSIAHRHHQDRLRDELAEIKLVPIQAAFDELKTSIIESYRKACAAPGLPVGMRSGVALGGPLSQMSLNTFHNIGTQSGFAQAFQVVRDSLTGSKANRAPSMRVYFKKAGTGTNLHDVIHEGTFDSIIALRPQFEQTTVKDAVMNQEILTQTEAADENVPEITEFHRKIRPQQFENFTTQFTYVLKLRLNTYRMYSHKITMLKLAQAIEGPSPPDLINCVWRSQRDGVMYVIVDESKDLGREIIAQPHAVLIFLQQLIRKFDQFIAGGIPNILALEPTEIQVLDGISRIARDAKRPQEHFVYTNNRKTRWQGISLADLQQLFERAGFAVTGANTEKLYIKVLFDNQAPGSLDLMSELKRRIKVVNEKPVPDRTLDEQALLRATRYHYANTRGANYRKLVWRDDLDLFRTADNDAHSIQDDFGIDAARVFLILKFRQILQKFSASINGRHISLVFDLLTNLGLINSLTFTGLNRRKIGTLPLASSERAIDTFVNAAFYGGKEAVSGVSSSIYIGRTLGQIGTGGVRVQTDQLVAPADRPIAPSIDELTDLEGFELTPQELDLENLLQGEISLPELSAEPVDHEALLKTSTIISEVPPALEPQIRDLNKSLAPPGATLTIASRTVDRALENITIGTGLIVEPPRIPQASNPVETATDTGEIQDINDIISLEDLELVGPVLARPTQSASLGQLQSQVKVISRTTPPSTNRGPHHNPPSSSSSSRLSMKAPRRRPASEEPIVSVVQSSLEQETPDLSQGSSFVSTTSTS